MPKNVKTAKLRGIPVFSAIAENWQTLKKSHTRKETFRQILIWISVLILTAWMLSAVNDVTAMNRSDRMKTVTISQGATTRQAMNSLHHAGLISHPRFCTWILTITHQTPKTGNGYTAGTYELSRDMGVEEMNLILQEGNSPSVDRNVEST